MSNYWVLLSVHGRILDTIPTGLDCSGMPRPGCRCGRCRAREHRHGSIRIWTATEIAANLGRES